MLKASVIAVVYLASLASSDEGSEKKISCYSCTSATADKKPLSDSDFKDKLGNDEPCPTKLEFSNGIHCFGENVCNRLELYFKADDKKYHVVSRGCGPADFCESRMFYNMTFDGKHRKHTCKTCNDHLCNAADTNSHPFLWILSAIAMFIIRY